MDFDKGKKKKKRQIGAETREEKNKNEKNKKKCPAFKKRLKTQMNRKSRHCQLQ